MGFNFRKSVKIGPARINVSKSGIGYSVGTKGARISKSAKGKTRITAGIPGAGISYSKSLGGRAKHRTQSKANRTQKKSVQSTKTQHSAATRAPVEKSWLMAVIMAIVGFLVVGVVSFVGILILYAIISLFTAGELPVWANWLILVVTPLCLALLAGYFGFMQMKPEIEEDTHTDTKNAGEDGDCATDYIEETVTD